MTSVKLPGIKYRIESIDILRGIIMLVMAIDHTRDFFHAYSAKPTDLATTTPILFFTRWITHFCAALFVFLSGVSVNLAGTRRTKMQLSGFLLKRGIWLILIEFILLTFAITLDPLYHLLIFQIIWVIGASMIILAALIWLPLPAIAILGVILFFGHDLLNTLTLPAGGIAGFLWKFFFTAAVMFQQIDTTHSILILYTLLPWTGVMLIGYTFGQLYHKAYDTGKRKKILLGSGLFLVLLFVILRTINIYGDPNPWKAQATTALSIIAYFNVSKYPPSLIYLCMTIGPGLIFLALSENMDNALTRILKVYGSVPFFYYILHFYLLRILNVCLFYAQGYTNKNIITPRSIMLFRPVEFGFNLFGVYMVWLFVIVILYFPCRWFAKYKSTHGYWWLSYL